MTEQDVALAHSAFSPFSIGPRGCIGKGVAYLELRLALARTLFLYDMRVAPGTHLGEGGPRSGWARQRTGEYQLKDTFTSHKVGPLVEFRLRE